MILPNSGMAKKNWWLLLAYYGRSVQLKDNVQNEVGRKVFAFNKNFYCYHAYLLSKTQHMRKHIYQVLTKGYKSTKIVLT